MKLLFLTALCLTIATSSLSALSISDHWQKIEARTNASDWQNAYPLIQNAIAEYPQEEGFRITESWVLRNLKRHREAVSAGRKAMADFPMSAKIKEALSYSLCALFDEIYSSVGFQKDRVPAEAHAIAADAYRLLPMAWSATVYGNSLRVQGKLAEAVKVLERAARLYPKESFVRENLAFAYFDLADYELNTTKNHRQSLALANRGLLLKAGNDWGLRITAYANLNLKKFDEALAVFKNLHAQKPQDTQVLNDMGYTYYAYTQTLWHKRDKRNLLRLQTDIRLLADQPAAGAKHFVGALRNIADATEDYRSLADFLKALAAKRPEPFFLAMAGSVLNQLHLQLQRQKSPEAAQIQTESNIYLRSAMATFENQNPSRPRRSGLTFPLKGRVMVVAQFDGGGTHSGFEKYSYDFMHVDEANSVQRKNAPGKKNSDFYTFGEPVLAVLDGEVVNVEDDQADHSDASQLQFGPMNHIQIRHANGVMSHYAHLKKGSARVRVGMQVKRGQVIAAVGNSGMSHAPHLHFSVVTDDWVSVFYTFEQADLIRAGQTIRGESPFLVGDVLLNQ
ncbi:peptidoglycan DD-metalloendopeptidase family protein [Turneriella parva]|uniref:Peptidase M23 n=1 Tax=Turneriella parva (strain ATCC BAA-1111 / DSM 21527 / NCTC 11395 / H) TaxID=869212 RepID=I4B6X8_TURPD|nr:peptidoglycan DD-metalloendopeptidase family protein [Turneriella parva]AFM13035.1 Peptidase M23 [Turneriella parva DSM 21527]